MDMIPHSDLKKNLIVQPFIDSLANIRLYVDRLWEQLQLQVFSHVKLLEKGQLRHQQFQFFQCGLLPLPQMVSQFHILTYLKYGILVLFVIVLPMTMVNEVGMGDPFFCKYLCPAGILEGGIPLSLADASIRASLGWLFTWKGCILLGVVVLSVFFYRPFCKWLCPLGAFYSLCNRIAVYRLTVDTDKCTACGACSRVCKMDVDVFRTPNHAECIRCGDCVAACPHQAVTRTFSLKNQIKKKETV